MNFEWKKFISPIFAREFRVFARAAQKRKKSKFGIFSSFQGYKAPAKFQEASYSSFGDRKGGHLALPPARPIIKIARLEEG